MVEFASGPASEPRRAGPEIEEDENSRKLTKIIGFYLCKLPL